MHHGSQTCIALLLGLVAASRHPHKVIVDSAHNGIFPRSPAAHSYVVAAGQSLILDFATYSFTIPPDVPMPAGATAPNLAQFVLAGKGYNVPIAPGASQVVISPATVQPWQSSSTFKGFGSKDTFFVIIGYQPSPEVNSFYWFWGSAFQVAP